jgi:hypothetical protein
LHYFCFFCVNVLINKVIKKVINILLLILLLLATIPTAAFIILQNAKVQTWLTHTLTQELSSYLGTNITIEKVSVTFINRFLIQNLYIEDLNSDTLIYAPEIALTVSNFNINQKAITFKKLVFRQSEIHFVSDSMKIMNFKFILDKIQKPREEDISGKIPWKIKVQDVNIENSIFSYTSDIRKNIPTGIDFSNIRMTSLNLELINLQLYGDSIEMHVNKLDFKENSGFAIHDFYSHLIISKNFLQFNKLTIETEFSEFNAPVLHFSFFDFEDFSDVINLVNIKMEMETSTISFRDISFFSPKLLGFNEVFNVSGLISGNISNLSGKDFLLQYNKATLLKTNFNMIGLPDFKTTFMHFDIEKLITTNSDIENLEIPGSGKKIDLPENLRKLGRIEYTGKYTGYPDDFVTYGKFSTSLGSISTDILLKPDAENVLRFTGRLKATDFMIGKMLNAEDKVGKISMNGNISGISSKGKLFAELESTIDSFLIFGYNYKNIDILGTLTETGFNGSFAISDPNIDMSFDGKVDFSDENPGYAFTANVVRARPYYLNIGQTDPSFFLSFLLKTNFTGRNIDDVNGEISLVNSLFSNDKNQLQVYDFKLKAKSENNNGSIEIRSDILDGEITGVYQFSTLKRSINTIINKYIPSVAQNELISITDDKNNFNFDIRLKNILPTVEFFFPEYSLANNSSVQGSYSPTMNKIQLKAQIPTFNFNENLLSDISITTNTAGKNYVFNINSSSLTFKNKMKVENIQINATAFSDSMDIKLLWNNGAKPLFSGKLDILTVFENNHLSQNTRLKIHQKPSSFIFNDTVWNVSESLVVIDSSSIEIDSLAVGNERQNMYVAGTLSKDPDDIIFMKFNKLDIETFNLFTSRSKITLAGILSGEASLQSAFDKPVFLSDLTVSNLTFNNENLGQANIKAGWNNSFKKISILAETIKGENRQLKAVGSYQPDNGEVNFDIDLDKIRITAIEPFLSELISQLRGMASGKVTMSGTLKSPLFNGDINVQKNSLLVDYLMTPYYFSNDLKIINNNIVFKDFEIYDSRGSKAIAQGTVFMNDIKNIRLDIRISANNFNFLKTTEKDNELFYGEVNATGIVRITGPINDLMMDINAKTDRNSVFYIPLYGAEEIYEHNFIQWVSSDSSGIPENGAIVPGYEVQLKGLKMNFDLEITPDAQIQLIFDPKVGDKMRGWGSGNLKMMINTFGRFEIYGDMVIERGDYLFTLKNLINKYFEVERGGTISWDGDPLDANINLKAVYSLKASVYPIAPDPMESLRRRIPVDILFNMTGKLMNPVISPDIQLPTADQETRNIVKNRISTDEEMMKQFLSLLIVNNFYSDQNTAGLGGAAQRSTGVAGSELFANQLSNWFSQISKDFDLGVNYRPGDEITTQQLELAFSTQLFNDRVRINTNVGIGGTQTAASPVSNPNNIVGDFDVDYKITESGKLHLKAFNRSNDNLLIRTSPYTQGVGFTYREEFNSFGELMKRYGESIGLLFSKDKRILRREENEEIIVDDTSSENM